MNSGRGYAEARSYVESWLAMSRKVVTLTAVVSKLVTSRAEMMASRASQVYNRRPTASNPAAIWLTCWHN